MKPITTIYSLLTSAVDVKVYPDSIPESASVPAISYFNIGYSSSRNTEGRKTKQYESWRVIVEASSSDDLTTIINQLEALDNTSNSDFSKIYSKLNQIEPKDVDALHRRAFIDVTLY